MFREWIDLGGAGLRRRPVEGALPARSMIGRLRRQMKASANPEKAAGMRAYMKSTMPYYGIKMPEVRAISRQVFDGSPMTCVEWRETVLELWRRARHREERHSALVL